MHDPAVEPSKNTEWRKVHEVKRYDHAPQSDEHSIGSAGTEGVDTVFKCPANQFAGTRTMTNTGEARKKTHNVQRQHERTQW